MAVTMTPNSGEVCSNCHNFVSMFVSPNGMRICPRCGFAPALGRIVQASPSRESFVPPRPPIPEDHD